MSSARQRMIAVAMLFVLAAAGNGWTAEPLARHIYPLAKIDGMRMPNFELDLAEVPDDKQLAAWGKACQELCKDWFPIMCRMLATDHWTPPETIRLIMKKDMKPPASTSGAKIYLNAQWIAKRPGDFGMVIHELTHVIQNYPPGQPGWLVEGIADYIRYWKYEPEKQRKRVSEKASYRDGYGTAGGFLAWLVWNYDRSMVRRLDESLRNQGDVNAVFQQLTGKDVDTLWKQYVESQER